MRRLAWLLLAQTAAASTSRPRPALSTWLRTVPLARYGPAYYLTRGEFRRCSAEGEDWEKLPIVDVLELAAGRDSYWSQEVARARPDVQVTAADKLPPLACGLCNVENVAANNADLAAFANGRRKYDLVFGSHMLCTCRRVVGGNRTCGGLPFERESVAAFVDALATLLRPGKGIAIFDHEGGWPFGLEKMFRQEARARGLGFAVRRGPGFTNVDYVFYSGELEDDVSPDLVQRSSRLIDCAALIIVLAAVALDEPPPGIDVVLPILAVRYALP
eukprot:CAMPEP_0119282286 /NCGR_PEP_ID=MMETSP1329-20130426/26403_1 /TAXON_ID=114041 /ORGANISM="Genus nov. species nov., Strain RCC1024" /LENGTH=273 /DNA_ID=CAMNT_0007282935 /DNA_START=235 /DNA_END=1052 /DNA_ORIENTATION=+